MLLTAAEPLSALRAGSPWGVEVKRESLQFLAWVSKSRKANQPIILLVSRLGKSLMHVV